MLHEPIWKLRRTRNGLLHLPPRTHDNVHKPRHDKTIPLAACHLTFPISPITLAALETGWNAAQHGLQSILSHSVAWAVKTQSWLTLQVTCSAVDTKGLVCLSVTPNHKLLHWNSSQVLLLLHARCDFPASCHQSDVSRNYVTRPQSVVLCCVLTLAPCWTMLKSASLLIHRGHACLKYATSDRRLRKLARRWLDASIWDTWRSGLQ